MLIRSRHAQQGYTLIELGLVATIIVFLIASTFVGYNMIQDRLSSNKIVKDFALIFAGAQDWRVGKVSYTGVTMQKLYNIGLVPDTIGNGSGTNAWSGNYTVAAMLDNVTHVTLTATNIDTKQCLNLVEKLRPNSLSGTNASCTSATVTVSY